MMYACIDSMYDPYSGNSLNFRHVFTADFILYPKKPKQVNYDATVVDVFPCSSIASKVQQLIKYKQ